MRHKTILYRAYGKNHELLYIGISHQVFARFDQHAHTADWMYNCWYVNLQHFPYRKQAMEAERVAIQNEKPKYNQIHKREKDEARNLSSKTKL